MSHSFIWSKVYWGKGHRMQNNKAIKALRSLSLYLRPWLCQRCSKTRFKESCKSHTVTPQRLCELALSWRGKNLYYCKADYREGQVLDGKGQYERDSQRPTGGFPLTERSLQQSCQRYPVFGFHVLHIPSVHAGSRSWHTGLQHTKEKVLWDEGTNEDGRGQIHRQRRWGTTPRRSTCQDLRQETNRHGLWRKMSEMMFVRKVALLPEKLLPIRYFKLRGSKDLRVGICPF